MCESCAILSPPQPRNKATKTKPSLKWEDKDDIQFSCPESKFVVIFMGIKARFGTWGKSQLRHRVAPCPCSMKYIQLSSLSIPFFVFVFI
jgi:hypothetical protein